jgi:hypothetical protein
MMINSLSGSFLNQIVLIGLPNTVSFSLDGEAHFNRVFVGDNNNGNLYYFEINSDRDGFILDMVPVFTL